MFDAPVEGELYSGFLFTCGIEWVLVLKLAFILHFMASIPELIFYGGCKYCFFMAAN